MRRDVDESVLAEMYADHLSYWQFLVETIPEYGLVFSGQKDAASFRSGRYNHLLFRPIGQRAFASAVHVLVARGTAWRSAVRQLASVNLRLEKREWWHLLWDPVRKRMLTDASNRNLAETFLLYQLGERARTSKKEGQLQQFLKERERKGLLA